MRPHGAGQPRHHAVAAARGLTTLAALWLAGCSFHPDGLGGGMGAPDTAVADSALADVRLADVTTGDGAVADGGPDGALDGAVLDAAPPDAAPPDAAQADADQPDALVFLDAMPPPLDAAVPDAFVFLDAGPPPLDAAIPDATVFMDAATGPGPGELWSTVAAAQPPVIDGNLDTTANEWPRARCITMNPNNVDHVDDVNRAIVGKPGPDDSSGFFCSQWSAAGLYVAARVHDDNHQANSFEIYNDDSVAFYLDGDDTRDGTIDANDHAFMVAPGFLGTRTGDFFHNGGLASGINFSANNTSGSDMDIEGFLPWAALGRAPPAAGARLGFDFVIADDDDMGGLFQNGSNDVDMDLWWYRRAVTTTLCNGHEDVWCNPALMGEVVLK